MKRKGIIFRFIMIVLVFGALSSKAQDMKMDSISMAIVETDIITMKEIGIEKMDYEKLREINGNIKKRSADHFSFSLINYCGTKVYADNIKAADGKFDEADEDFSLIMPNKLPDGQYRLIFYNDSKNNQRKENEKSRFIISL